MPHHEWGSDFDFDGLSKAEQWINKAYRRMTKKQMITKEKYGTIRYEYTSVWLIDGEDLIIFLDILKRATIKFPEVAGEIVNDIVPVLEVEGGQYLHYVSNYYKGYFEAILMVKHKSQWESFQ